MNLTVVTPASEDLSRDLLVIERLAAALEKAASVDEIKDVRDRSMAIQLYTRKKAGGLAAAQSAGRVVTDATAMLARLYHEEPVVSGKRTDRPLDRDQEVPGRVAVAQAAGLDPATLSRLKPLVESPPEKVEAAKVSIEARGDVVTPTALVRELTSVSSAADYDGDEWYTPSDVIELARSVLGEIDLDPASNPHAQKTVKAKKFWTKQDDALVREWHGRVFCNPPYSTTLVQRFTEHLLGEIDAKRVSASIYLVNNCTDTAWFHSLADRFPFCLTKGRIPFLNRSGQKFQTRAGRSSRPDKVRRSSTRGQRGPGSRRRSERSARWSLAMADGNIRSRKRVAEQLWDWKRLSQAFSGSIRPCDIDGIVEVNGFFLILEAKPADALPPDGGQRRVLEELARLPRFTVLVLYGDPGTGSAVRWQRIGSKENSRPCSMSDVIAFCAEWEAKARAARAA